jgi:transposase
MSGKRGKNDAADAAAICEAVTRPNMRFVPIKEEHQQIILCLLSAALGFRRNLASTRHSIRNVRGFGFGCPA